MGLVYQRAFLHYPGLKTHRIVARLAEKGIVAVERSGNTNQVSLGPWEEQNQQRSEV